MTQANLWRRLLALFLAVATVSSLALEGAALSLSPEETGSEQTPEQQTEQAEEAEDTGALDGENEGAPEEAQPTEPTELEGGADIAGPAGPAEPAQPGEPTEPAQPEEPGGPAEPGEETQEPVEPEPEEGVGQDDPEALTPEEEQTEPEEADDGAAAVAETSYGLRVTGTKTLTLSYDDRYSFASSVKGYAILSIRTNQVTSYQVSKGSKTSKLDGAVLQTSGSSVTDVVATGVGTATVLLVPKNQLEQGKAALKAETALVMETGTAQASEAAADQAVEGMPDAGLQAASVTEVQAIQVNVTVKPAKLTMMFLAGQSNMEGENSGNTGYHPENSVVCPEGEVYSTYLPKTSNSGWRIGKIPTSEYTEDPQSVVAGSLTGTTNQKGTALNYPLYALTSKGSGKTGPDSGLAYEWNRLTGDKVWTINAAWGGSNIAKWEQGGTVYTRALNVYRAAIKTMKAEVSAGHYTEGNRLLFWLQGESDRNMAAETYLTGFQSMKSGLGSACGIDYFGLIIPRSSISTNYGDDDIYMNGPRIAQYYMGNSADDPYGNVYVVSNVNEQWISNSGVKAYFQSAYPSGRLTYPLRSTTTLSGLPTTVKEIHGDAHYSQVGHNENGLTAARNLYYIVKNQRPSSSVRISWRDNKGVEISQPLSLAQNSAVTVVPVAVPLYNAKGISIQTASSGLSYAARSGQLKGSSQGTFKLRAENASGETVGQLSVQVAKIAEPVLSGIVNQTKGVCIAWGKISSAVGYRVYRKTSGTDWVCVGTTAATKYVDTTVKNGVTYLYTVQAYAGDASSQYGSSNQSITYLAPVTLSISNAAGKAKLNWGKNDKADGFYICRRLKNGSWIILRYVSSSTLSYSDTTAVSGTLYEYAVVAEQGKVRSGYDVISWVGLTTPKLTGAQSVEGGVQVKWSKVTGATGYRVYRKTAGTNWTRIAMLSGGSTLSYVDTGVTNGKSYTYTVIATYGSILSGYNTAGCSTVYLTTPAITAVKNRPNGIGMTWKAVSGSTGYQVYRKTSGTNWKYLATVTGTGYTDTEKHQSGTTYIYTVRARKGSILSGFHTAGYSIYHLGTPKLTGAQSVEGGVQVKWGKVTGATGYRVFRKTAGTDWTRIATLSGGPVLSYADTDVKHGKTYSYSVVATYGGVLSSYDAVGCSTTYLTTPAVTAVKNRTNGIGLIWQAVSGSNGYRVYRKTSGTNWKYLATVTGTSYMDTEKHQSGTTYLYTVRACKGSTLSGFHTAGYSIYYLDTPAVSKMVNTSSGISLTWNRVAGATSYLIYRKSGSSGWSWLATVTGSSYLDKTAKAGTTYTYTVFSANGAERSDYNRTGFTLRRLTTPELTAAKAAAGGIAVRWNGVSGASSYHVYRKTSSSGWIKVGSVTRTSYTDTAVVSGTVYTYTVRAAWGGQLSDFDRTGLSVKAK